MMKCLKVEDALSYLDQVKARFSGQGAIYMNFLDVMREFKAQTIGTEVVIRRVRELFEGHPDLITGFNTFIPQGYRMDALQPTTTQNLSTRSTCTPTANRTLTISCGENISPTKSISSVKPSDSTSDWLASTCISLGSASQHDNSTRAVHASVIPSNLPTTVTSPSIRAQTPALPGETPVYHSNQQQYVSSDFQENYPNVVVRNPNTCSQGSHIYQQQHQQQIQSFHHALHYVNKIKNRFQGIPDVYKRFLDILQWYQKEQRHSDAVRRKQAEMQVYQDVAKLFDGQEDLLQEFSQFLPESFGVTNAVSESAVNRKSQLNSNESLDVPISMSQLLTRVSEGISSTLSSTKPRQNQDNFSNQSVTHAQMDTKKLKRLAPATNSFSSNISSNPGAKKSRTARDVSIVDGNQLTSGLGVTLLHKIRDALDADSPSGFRSYQTFLQHVRLFHRSIISAEELLETTYPLFIRHVDVWKRFSDLIMSTSRHDGINQFQATHFTAPGRERIDGEKHRLDNSPSNSHARSDVNSNHTPNPPVSLISLVSEVSQKRLDLDFTKLRTCGVSYRALPSNFPQSKCSGRQKCPIAKEVLNDSYISFSSLTSEDSQFVSSKKNQYEENMYRVEDERYEVDMVTELNRAAMQNLVVIKRRMDRMSREELNQFHLDDKLGGTSAILMRKAIHRVYGDKALDVIYGLKNCPNTVIPLIIQRMRQKDSEWTETIRNYQRSWADQDARNYLRSLDHQGTTFKQRDAPFIRSKTMVSQIEAIARNDKVHTCQSVSDPVGKMIFSSLTHNLFPRDVNSPGNVGSALANVIEGSNEDDGPHLTLVYPPSDVRPALLEDAASLIIHHVKRQSNASKDDKRSMKSLVRTVLQDIFMASRFPMSDDEDDEDEDEEIDHKLEEDEVAEGGCEADDLAHNRNAFRYSKSRRMSGHRRTQCGEHSTVIDTESLQKDTIKSESDTPNSTVEIHNCTGSSSPLSNNLDMNDEIRFQECSYNSGLPKRECYSLLYGNNHWYAFIRLHHLLLCRLHQLRTYGSEAMFQASQDRNDSHVQAAEVLRLKRHVSIEPSQYYSRALNLVKDLLDGGEDITTYEDRLRDMFGIYAYPWFTMDRLVTNIVRQLQALASGDELSRRLTSLQRSWHGNSNTIDRSTATKQTNSVFTSPTHSDVCGPLFTRFCRLTNENSYYSQVLSTCALFSTPNGSSSSTNNSSGTFGSNGIGQSASQNPVNSSQSNIPNLYLLIMLSESSSMLIRLIRPSFHVNCTTSQGHDICHPHSGRIMTAHNLHRANIKLDGPIKNWSDYLKAHLLWSLGCVPQVIYSRIRPVFLYRTVRRCVNTLTRKSLNTQQQLLVETGDTQPGEILAGGLLFSNGSQAQNMQSKQAETTEDDGELKRSKATTSFEHDVWEFMCQVFRNDLTRRELFRDTYSSDCMQSTQRLDARSSRNYKINWSVGSYGIFVRRRKRVSKSNVSSDKWYKFHSNWLSKHMSCQYFPPISEKFPSDPSNAPASSTNDADKQLSDGDFNEITDDKTNVNRCAEECGVLPKQVSNTALLYSQLVSVQYAKTD